MADFTLVIGNKNYSSWSLRPWFVLQYVGADFEEIRIPLDQPQTKAQLLSHSPTARVPVLKHQHLVLWESLAICEYLAEQFPAAQLWPEADHARAIARAVSHEMHAGFTALRTHMPMDCRSRYPGQGHTPEVLADIERIQTLWRDCRQTYGSEGDFLFGDITIADAMYAPVVSRFVTYGVAGDPISQAYCDAIWHHPVMQTWLTAAAAETEVIEQP
ncbi:MAG TPA: glutathione S-transferase family protein [Candidatus Obscuribacterales bacterium]